MDFLFSPNRLRTLLRLGVEHLLSLVKILNERFGPIGQLPTALIARTFLAHRFNTKFEFF